jgi:nucleoprotein TPR
MKTKRIHHHFTTHFVNSRLQNNTNALNAQITELQTSSTLSTSSTAPLKFENTRLRSELESLNAHCKWLESELNTRTTQTAEFKINNSKTLHDLRNQMSATNTERDELSSQVSSLKMHNESFRRRMETSQKELLDKEQDHADFVHELQIEVQTERRLVSLNKENIVRLEERYNDVVREMGSMKALAADAEEQRAQEIFSIRAEAEEEFNKVLEQAEQSHDRQIEEFQGKLDEAMVEKAELEDEFMAGGARALGDGSQVLQLTNEPDDGEPLTLTKLYEKLSDAQDETRKERSERKKLELYLERVSKEFESAAPRQKIERKEFELAMTQNQEMHNRLNEAWEECNNARRDLQQSQRQLSNTTRECHELRLENSDMAKQVQTLLQKSLGGEDLAAEIQEQNQRMLKEHHRMSTAISELEEKLDSDTVQQKLEEFEQMKEERANQAMLVKNIIQQRDLYRALLVKNDASLLTEYGADGAIVAAKDQIEKFTEVEAVNKELVDSIAKLKSNVTSLANEKIGFEVRLARSDAHSNELSSTNIRLQADLLAAHSATARINAEATFHVEKVSRLEEALETARNDFKHATAGKNSLQRLSEELQSALSLSKNQQSKLEEQLRQATVQVRLVETNSNAMKDTESRLNAENNSLRSELARHISLQESMQKIESTLSTRGDKERNRLEDEVNTLSNALSSEKEQHSLSLEKLQNELADAELCVQDANKQKEESLTQVISAKDELARANTNIKTLTDKSASLEKELNTAKIKLGDNDVDTTDQEKIENLANDLATARVDLDATNKKVDNYKKIAEASEKTLVDATAASETFKKLTIEKMMKLKQELKAATETGTAKREAFEDLSKDLSTSRGEQEKVVDDLKATIDALKTELQSSKSGELSSDRQRGNAMEELNIYKAEARSAKDNYERELALHADARKELQTVRQKIEEETRVHQNMQSQLDTFNSEFESEKKIWEGNQNRLEEAQKRAETRLAESQEQNNILHSQLAALNESFEKQQAEKINAAASTADDAGDTTETSADASLAKQISELREVVRLMRNEKEVIETQLGSARRTSERERAAAEIAKRSLDNLRSEMELLQKGAKDSDMLGSVDSSEAVAAKLKQAEDHLVLLRESNTLLRVETEKTSQSLEETKKEVDEVRATLEPVSDKCRSLEVDKAALDAEKASLVREVDAWKDRVQGLLKKFNQVSFQLQLKESPPQSSLMIYRLTFFFFNFQIDPEEHANALKKVEESEKQCVALQKDKAKAEKDIANVKTLVTRLNKEMSKQKSLAEASKAALAKAKAEKEALIKSTTSTETTKKEVDDLKKAKEQVDAQLKSTKVDLQAQKKRLEGLKTILKTNNKKSMEMKQTMEDLKQKEKEAQLSLSTEKKARETALKEVASMKASLKEKYEDVTMASAPEQKSDQAPMIPDPKVIAKKDPPSSDTQEGTPATPKVPNEGFKFVASKMVSTALISGTSKEDQLTKNSSASSSESNIDAKQQSKTKTAPVVEKATVLTNASSQNPATESATPASSSATQAKTKQGNAHNEDAKGPAAVTMKQTTTAKALAKDKSTTLATKNVAPATKPTPTAPMAKEGSLREKLLKKKRALVQQIASPPAKRPAPATKLPHVPSKTEAPLPPVPSKADAPLPPAPLKSKAPPKPMESEETNTVGSNTEQPKTEVTAGDSKISNAIEDKKESEVTNTAKMPAEPEPNIEEAKAQEASTSKVASAPAPKSVFGINPTAKPFMMFGSGNTAPTFGKPSSSLGTISTGFGKSLSSEPKESTATFGAQPKTFESSSSGSAFLNLKPPGSGSSTPLIFGTSSNIKLPTPSKDPLPIGQQPFAAFKAQPFGTNPFGSASATTAASPFGGIASKKRSLDSDEKDEDSSSKLAKVEENTTESNKLSEENTNDEAKI